MKCRYLDSQPLAIGLVVAALIFLYALTPISICSLPRAGILSIASSTIKPQFAPTVPYATPSILIAGAGKGGTTDLYIQLVENFATKIIRGISKELSSLSKDWSDPYTESGTFATYLGKLMHPCMNYTNSFQECSQNIQAGLKNETRYTIDATPRYLERPYVPLNLKRISPQTKVIILLREPISRAQSLYNQWYSSENQIRSASITEAAKDFLNLVHTPAISDTLQQLLQSEDQLEIQSLYYNLANLGILENLRDRLFGGSFYAYSLATWSSIYFQPNRVLIIDSHTYFKDRTYVLNTVSQFLFGEPLSPDQKELSKNAKVRNAKSNYKNDALLDDQEKRKLKEFFHPHLVKLGKTLKVLKDHGCWVVGFDNTAYWPFTF